MYFILDKIECDQTCILLSAVNRFECLIYVALHVFLYESCSHEFCVFFLFSDASGISCEFFHTCHLSSDFVYDSFVIGSAIPSFGL